MFKNILGFKNLFFQLFFIIQQHNCEVVFVGYAKYYEDDCNIICDRIYLKEGFDHGETNKKRIKILNCPYCEEIFEDREILFSHIRTTHQFTGPIVLINDIILKERIFVSEVKSAIVYKYGYDEEVLINNRPVSTLPDESDALDISEDLKNNIFHNSRPCEISIGDFHASIEKYSLYSIDQDIVKTYIQQWEDCVVNGIPFSINKAKDPRLNQAEQHYLEGIFNYFVACQAKGKEKADRYNEANCILKKFDPIDSLGLCIQKIVSFKLNWVKTLKNLCSQNEIKDDFTYVVYFFENKECNLNHSLAQNERKLFIEDELQEVLNAIIAFNKGEYGMVKNYLNSHDADYISDINLRDKILLLKYRMMIIEGNKTEAEYALKEIITDDFKGKDGNKYGE